MRFAIISDIHSNIVALKSVLEHIRKRGIHQIICLGDVVGYGPNPLESIELIMENCDVCLKGNHDEALIEGVCFFNPVAKQAIEWTMEYLLQQEESKKEKIWNYMESLPMIYTWEKYSFIHGSPTDPTMDYILAREIEIEEKKFRNIFSFIDDVLFVGHTHMPCVITESLDVFDLQDIEHKYERTSEKIIINVGSVGQPRDKDPRACYLEVIDDFFFFHRVEYDVEAVCQAIIDHPRLSNSLGKRLLAGA